MKTPQKPSGILPSTQSETTSPGMSFAEMIMAAGDAAMEEVKKDLAGEESRQAVAHARRLSASVTISPPPPRIGNPGAVKQPESRNPSVSARDEYVKRVVRFDRLPTHWELCQLAAMAGNEVPEDHSFNSVEEAGKRAALAMHIWEAAGAKLIEASERWERAGRSFDELSPLYGPLKVDNHFLPQSIEWNANHFSGDDPTQPRISFDTFLEIVVGLAKEEDRMKWWRAYLTAKVKGDKHADRWGSYENIDEEAKLSPEWSEPENFVIDSNCIPNIIKKMKADGISPIFQANYYLVEFRKWRLTMKSPTKKAAVPHDLEDCVKKGWKSISDG